jgi:signal transduction histidine kinase
VNVVRNAVQALSQTGSPEGQPRIDVTASREGGTVCILIKDNGPGIPERAKVNLFAPFQGSAQKGGTGLGLPIAAELVQLHGGTITLDESHGKTCFKIAIPDRLSAMAHRTDPKGSVSEKRARFSGPNDAPEQGRASG